jgi:hypothetical protein
VLDPDRANCSGDCDAPVQREAAALIHADGYEHLIDHPAIELSNRTLAHQSLNHCQRQRGAPFPRVRQPWSRASRPARFCRAHPDTSMVCRNIIGVIKFMIN